MARKERSYRIPYREQLVGVKLQEEYNESPRAGINSARMAVVTRAGEIMVFYNTHNYLGKVPRKSFRPIGMERPFLRGVEKHENDRRTWKV